MHKYLETCNTNKDRPFKKALERRTAHRENHVKTRVKKIEKTKGLFCLKKIRKINGNVGKTPNTN